MSSVDIVDETEDERARRVERDLVLLRSVVASLSRGSVPPPPERRDSLPVRAAKIGAKGGYKLTRGAATVLGLIVAVAQIIAPDHAILRAVFRALFEAF